MSSHSTNSQQLPPSCGAMLNQSSLQQIGNGGGAAVAVNVNNPTDGAVDAAGGGGNSKVLRRLLYSSGFATLVMAAATAFYQGPHGAVFQQHRFAYYTVLAGISAAGLAEIWAAFWLSISSGGQHGRGGRSRAFRTTVACVSVVPLVAIIGLGGYAVTMKG